MTSPCRGCKWTVQNSCSFTSQKLAQFSGEQGTFHHFWWEKWFSLYTLRYQFDYSCAFMIRLMRVIDADFRVAW